MSAKFKVGDKVRYIELTREELKDRTGIHTEAMKDKINQHCVIVNSYSKGKYYEYEVQFVNTTAMAYECELEPMIQKKCHFPNWF